MDALRFEWDDRKNKANHSKHHVSEERYYCFGEAGGGVLTVRFKYRSGIVRIIGAGYWRKGKAVYEKENRL